MRGTEGGGPADARGRQRHLSPAFLSLPGAHHSKAWGLCQPGRTCPLPPPAPVVFVPGSSSWWTSFVACPLPKGLGVEYSPPPPALILTTALSGGSSYVPGEPL